MSFKENRAVNRLRAEARIQQAGLLAASKIKAHVDPAITATIETLEYRTLLSSVPALVVQSIDRQTPVVTAATATTVSYAVTFNHPVTGVDATDFKVTQSGAVSASTPVTVTPIDPSNYTVTITGIHGSGSIELDLVDDDSIRDAGLNPLGGAGTGNGSFAGPQFVISQSFPHVVSIDRANGAGSATNASSVDFTITFSKPVTGVSASAFSLALGAGVSASPSLTVTPVSSSVYTVTVQGITGVGTVGINLSNGSAIHDVAGNPLVDAQGIPSFTSQPSFDVGARPREIHLADLNADGIPDLVEVSTSPGWAGIAMGNGSTFGPMRTYAASNAKDVAVADFNGDGKPDLIIGQSGGVPQQILSGNGDGTFAPYATLDANYGVNSVAVADFDGDGKPDLLFGRTSYNGNNSLTVCLNLGNSQFTAARTWATDATPVNIAAADINGDGKTDIVSANISTAEIAILAGNGDGTFAAQKSFSVATQPASFKLVDVNGDGNLDVVSSHFAGSSVSLLLGNGDGSFKPNVTFAAGTYPNSVEVADVNGDGKPDLLVANNLDSNTSLLLGNGDGTFHPQQTIAVGAQQACIAVGDMNGDGRPDIATANGGDYNVSVLDTRPPAAFASQTYTIVASSGTIAGTPGVDQITLARNLDGTHIDWSLGSTSGQIAINSPTGLTINGVGGSDLISLNYTHGNPLPANLHLNGSFTLDALQGADPLAGTTLDIAQSTVYFSYTPGQSPVSLIQQYLKTGYNAGAWTGIVSPSIGAITSSTAAIANSPNLLGIGYADSATGFVPNQPANTIELRYTLMGDLNLDGAVNGTDALILGRNLFLPNSHFWTQGDFNYDGVSNLADASFLQKNWNSTVPTPPAIVAAPASVPAIDESNPVSTFPSAPSSPAASINQVPLDESPADSKNSGADRSQKKQGRRSIEIPKPKTNHKVR